MTAPKRQVWEWEGEAIGVRGATNLEDAKAMVLADADIVDEHQLNEGPDFPKGWGVAVWLVPTAFFGPSAVDNWNMDRVWPGTFDTGPGRGRVRVVWFTVPR